ncbi:hypothetical protein [Thalassospira sp. HJ]|uniref:hypothetical protein n=1 Tax=Thalassospira sp. HJ TaxID=1616823 RepID=UPI001269F180|nr:hypothetical protein [Thalassospira sp. HJ]
MKVAFCCGAPSRFCLQGAPSQNTLMFGDTWRWFVLEFGWRKKEKSYTALIWLMFLSVLAGPFATAPVQAQEAVSNIHWLKADVPPIGISSGPLAGKGVHGGIVKALLGHEAGPGMVEGHANIARLFSLIKSGNYCVPGLIKTSEREEFVYFTDHPTAVLDTSHLVYAASNKKLRDKIDENVSLRQLLGDGFVVGVGAGISYGDGIDEIIQSYEGESVVIRHPTPNFIEPILSMIEMERVDFSLAPPWAITWLLLNEKLKPRDAKMPKVITHPFREASTKTNYHVACTKNDWGRQAVALLDEKLTRADVQQALDRNARVWMSVKNAQEHLLD